MNMAWLVLPGLLEAGGAFYKAAGKRSYAGAPPKDGKRLAGHRLKDREPW